MKYLTLNTMIRSRQYSEYFTFYRDDAQALQTHFDEGGSLKMLTGRTDPRSPLYNCICENAEACFDIMMKYNAEPDYDTWELLFIVNRIDFMGALLTHGYLPPKLMALKYSWEASSTTMVNELTCFLCLKSVIYTLCISKTQRQPLSHLWRLIAKRVWDTRFDNCWISALG